MQRTCLGQSLWTTASCSPIEPCLVTSAARTAGQIMRPGGSAGREISWSSAGGSRAQPRLRRFAGRFRRGGSGLIPAANSSRMPPSRPRALRRSRASACGPHDIQRPAPTSRTGPLALPRPHDAADHCDIDELKSKTRWRYTIACTLRLRPIAPSQAL
jgi:hypothetical protein